MKNFYLLVAITSLLLTVGCGKKSEEKPVMTLPQETEMATQEAPFSDKDLRMERTESINGQTYQIALYRHADTTMPIIKDEIGDEYFDNCVEVSIKKDSTDFFTKTFTKGDFSEYISAEELDNSMLMGMAYLSVENDKLTFGAQVGLPGADGGMPFIITIDERGELSISGDNSMDASNPDEL